MTKSEYIEHFRALFENPLMEKLEYITLGTEYAGAYFHLEKTSPYRTYIPLYKKKRKTKKSIFIYRSDFEQGGKYFKQKEK